MTEMRILTVRQPWPWAIIHGGKNCDWAEADRPTSEAEQG